MLILFGFESVGGLSEGLAPVSYCGDGGLATTGVSAGYLSFKSAVDLKRGSTVFRRITRKYIKNRQKPTTTVTKMVTPHLSRKLLSFELSDLKAGVCSSYCITR
jgi:hypothetical protein